MADSSRNIKIPQWLDDKQNDQFINLMTVVQTEEDFNSDKWRKWHD